MYGLYIYLEIIGHPTTLTTSGKLSNNFFPSSSTNIDTATLQTVVEALRIRQKNIWEFYGRTGHKVDACIISGPNFLPPSLRRNMNQFNTLYSNESNDPLLECNSQPPEYHFKSRDSPSKTSPVVSAVLGVINHHTIDNVDVEVHPCFRLNITFHICSRSRHHSYQINW